MLCISDIVISAFALHTISQNKVQLQFLQISILMILAAVIRLGLNLGYLVNGLVIYMLLILFVQKKFEYNYILTNTFIFILIHILIMPIVNIVVFFAYHGFLFTDIELLFFAANSNIEFTYKMIFLLGLIKISIQRIETINTEKKYWRYFYVFIMLSFFTLIITLGFSNDTRSSINLITYSFLSGITLISTFLLYYFFQSLIISIKESTEAKLISEKNNLKLQKMLYDEKLNEEFKKYRHDLKNNLVVMQYLIQEKQFKAVHEYINKYVEQYNEISDDFKIDNIIVGAIIHNKVGLYPNIEFKVSCFLPRNISVSDLDMVAILGNLIDNACEYLGKEKIDGHVFIDIYQYYDNIFIEVQNECLRKDVSKFSGFNTSKQNKKEHGYGLQNVYKAVVKYAGTVEYEVVDGYFSLKILMNLPKDGD